jgi:hypothetical protein
MWRYYPPGSAGGFRSRGKQVWQIAMTRHGAPLPDCRASPYRPAWYPGRALTETLRPLTRTWRRCHPLSELACCGEKPRT